MKYSLDLLLECSFEEFEKQVFFPLVGCIVVYGENDGLHELGGTALRHLKDEFSQVTRVGL